MTYPNSPGYAANSATSRAAADIQAPKIGDMHMKILSLLSGSPGGMIVDEARKLLEYEEGRTFDRSTVAARFTELKENGYIRLTEETRKTPRGCAAVVYKIEIKGRDFLLNN